MTRQECEKLLKKDPILRATFELGVAEQWKYSAEPVLSKTGKGFLRSSGVSELEEIKNQIKQAAKDGGSSK